MDTSRKVCYDKVSSGSCQVLAFIISIFQTERLMNWHTFMLCLSRRLRIIPIMRQQTSPSKHLDDLHHKHVSQICRIINLYEMFCGCLLAPKLSHYFELSCRQSNSDIQSRETSRITSSNFVLKYTTLGCYVHHTTPSSQTTSDAIVVSSQPEQAHLHYQRYSFHLLPSTNSSKAFVAGIHVHLS